ncbi:hypothetical protein CLORAM_00840 [Thomasclavelia ramosa DSM 1402]|uniref:Uncharacterized protein n=1 Tax=Thomasclavelia ramosa DSM 1402 TaxID=445974 RepID=B0N322_9FIRM|nr:hypothetical protein CLORAM_00840 [Thomasclavelia ramosa DSM 1402]
MAFILLSNIFTCFSNYFHFYFLFQLIFNVFESTFKIKIKKMAYSAI